MADRDTEKRRTQTLRKIIWQWKEKEKADNTQFVFNIFKLN